MSHVSGWIDLRVDVAALCAWWRNEATTPQSSQDSASVQSTQPGYVNEERLAQLKSIKSERFDLTKLVRLCQELNSSFASKNYYSTAMLVRAIVDHVPPIFHCASFAQVIAQHGPRSFKGSMKALDESCRHIADHYLHVQIRQRESLPNSTQVNFSSNLDMLLGEIVRLLNAGG